MAETNAAKKPCVLIGTHDGTFHCDEGEEEIKESGRERERKRDTCV
jgi:hypothetical protein